MADAQPQPRSRAACGAAMPASRTSRDRGRCRSHSVRPMRPAGATGPAGKLARTASLLRLLGDFGDVILVLDFQMEETEMTEQIPRTIRRVAKRDVAAEIELRLDRPSAVDRLVGKPRSKEDRELVSDVRHRSRLVRLLSLIKKSKQGSPEQQQIGWRGHSGQPVARSGRHGERVYRKS